VNWKTGGESDKRTLNFIKEKVPVLDLQVIIQALLHQKAVPHPGDLFETFGIVSKSSMQEDVTEVCKLLGPFVCFSGTR